MFAATAHPPRSIRVAPQFATTIDLPLYAAPRRTEPGVYVRRQVVALLVLAVVLGALSFGLRSVVGALTSASASTGATAASVAPSDGASTDAASDLGAGRSARSSTYVVQPGDTLWTIARALQPVGDPAALVRALAKANGGSTLDVGDVLAIPGR